jgi:CRP-like cAMP-binding protein
MISPELLRRHAFFGGFSAAALKELAMAASEQTVAAGERLFTEGARADHFYFLAEGLSFPRPTLAALLEDDHFAATLLRKLADLISRRLRDTQVQLLSLTARQHA